MALPPQHILSKVCRRSLNAREAVLFLLIILILTACKRVGEPNLNLVEPPSPEAVALIDGQPITAEHFQEAMKRRNPQGIAVDPVGFKERVLDELIGHRVLLAQARAASYDKNPEIVAALEQLMIAKLKEDQLMPLLDQVTITDDETRAFYERHKERYTEPAMARAALVFVALPTSVSEQQRGALAKRIEVAREEALALSERIPSFGLVARKYSDDDMTRQAGGEIGWLREDGKHYRWPPQVIEAIFSLDKPGAVSEVIETETGLYLVKLIEKRAPIIQPLDRVAASIRQELTQDRRRALIDQFNEALLSRADVRINREAVEAVPLPGNVTRERSVAVKARPMPPPLPSR